MQAVQKDGRAKEAPSVMPHRFQAAQSVRNIWRVHVESGNTRAHIEQPEYWAHIARRLTPGDKIEILAENGSFYGEALVRVCEKNWAKVDVLFWRDYDAQPVSSAKYDVIWKGPMHKWAVVRLSDGEMVHKGSQTKDEGVAWLEQNKANLS